MVASVKKPATITKMMLEIDRLWESSKVLVKKEGLVDF